MLINVLLFIFFWLLGYITCRAYHKTDCSGNILIIDQGEESPVLMLEIFNGRSGDIQPGSIVKLGVKKENLTRK